MRLTAVRLLITLMVSGAGHAAPADAPSQALRERCLQTMKRATSFMVDRVSVRGGYVWQYLPDLSRRWGELEAYDTMIWLQPPGTTSMGRLFLEAYEATGDEYYYQAAEKVARALIWSQLECGGWNYVADFAGDRSLRRWYATVGKNAWRLEEFQHYYGNATFDDHVSTDAARFLLRIYLAKLDPVYRPSLDRAIRFVLDSQYPVGGWPQRYPLRYDFSYHGKPDYTSCITFNDDVAWENVSFLIECYRGLGDPRFLDPIRRGMDVYLVTQQGAPQPGWAQQYTLDLKPAGARTYEPQALSPDYTAANIDLLMRFYRLTGESRYLARIPEALDWLESCRLPESLTDGGRFTHPTYIALGSGAPIYVHRRGSNVVNGEYYVDQDPGNLLGHYSGKRFVDVNRLRRAFVSLKALKPDDVTHGSPLLPASAQVETAATQVPDWLAATDGEPRFGQPTEAAALRVIEALDQEGRWLTPHGMASHPYSGDGKPGPAGGEYARTQVGDETDTSPYWDRSGAKYISTRLFIENMRILIRFVEGAAGAERTAK